MSHREKERERTTFTTYLVYLFSICTVWTRGYESVGFVIFWFFPAFFSRFFFGVRQMHNIDSCVFQYKETRVKLCGSLHTHVQCDATHNELCDGLMVNERNVGHVVKLKFHFECYCVCQCVRLCVNCILKNFVLCVRAELGKVWG